MDWYVVGPVVGAVVAVAARRQVLIFLLALVALYSRKRSRRQVAERLFGTLATLPPKHDDPPQLGQGESS